MAPFAAHGKLGLGAAGVERHPEYRGRLRRRIGELIAEVAIPTTPKMSSDLNEWSIYLRCSDPWKRVAVMMGSLADAEMRGAAALPELPDAARLDPPAATDAARS